jgi:hypothetical protein
MSAKAGLGQDNWGRTTVAGQPAQTARAGRVVKTGTAETCQPGQASLKSLAGQVRLDRQRGQNAQHMTART